MVMLTAAEPSATEPAGTDDAHRGASLMPTSFEIMLSRPRKDVCPECKRETGVPIVYGEVDDGERKERALRGEIALYGCVMEVNAPKYHCLNCGNAWGLI